MSEKLETRITIGSEDFPVRFSYAYFFEARESDDEDEDTGEKKKFFSTMVLIPKDDKAVIAKINKLVQALVDDKFKGKSANLKLPLRDGDQEYEEKGDYLKGHYFFNCKSKVKPGVVGTETNDLTGKLEPLGPDEIKSGDYGRIAVNFYSYEGKKAKGVAVGLGNVQKLKDGESLGNSRSADEDFGALSKGFAD